MAEIDYDKLIEPENPDNEVEETKYGLEPEVDEASAPEKDEEENRPNQRIRQLVEEKNELKERLEKLENLQNQLNQKLAEQFKEPEPEPEPEIDFMDDPKGYVDVHRQQLEARLKHLESQDQEANNQTKQEIAMLRFQQSVNDLERQFSTEHPDYMKALEHNREYRLEELKLMGVTGDQARQVIGQEEVFLASQNLRGGNNPAEAAYNLALKRGYKPGAVDIEKVEQSLDEEVSKRVKASDAESMGSSSSPTGKAEDDAEHEAWAPIVEAYAEIYGAKAAKEMFGDLA